MRDRSRKLFIRILYLASFGLIVVTLSALWTRYHPVRYCSNEWISAKPDAISEIALKPVSYLHYSRNESISDVLVITNASVVAKIVSSLDGRFDCWRYMSAFDKLSTRRSLNMEIRTINGDLFVFRLSISPDDSFARYSQVHAETLSEAGDRQKLYGGMKASDELCRTVTELLKREGLSWKSAGQL